MTATPFSLFVLVVLAVLLVLFPIPALAAWVRRVRRRARVLLLCIAGLGLPVLYFGIVFLVQPESDGWVPGFFGVMLVACVVWAVALIWSMVGESESIEQRGFAVLPAEPPRAEGPRPPESP